MKHNVAKLLVTIMLLAQLGLAQHATVHFAVHGHGMEHHHNDGDQDHRKSADEQCQICLSAKSFSHALASSPQNLEFIIERTQAVQALAPSSYTQIVRTPYGPRDPPVRLI